MYCPKMAPYQLQIWAGKGPISIFLEAGPWIRPTQVFRKLTSILLAHQVYMFSASQQLTRGSIKLNNCTRKRITLAIEIPNWVPTEYSYTSSWNLHTEYEQGIITLAIKIYGGVQTGYNYASEWNLWSRTNKVW